MATSFKSPNPQFKTLELTAEAFTVIEKLEKGIEDIPWAEAVIVDADVATPNNVPAALTKDSVPTENCMMGVCHGAKRTTNTWQLHCSIANQKGVSPQWLGIYANCRFADVKTDDGTVKTLVLGDKTARMLIATCKATDPKVFNVENVEMKAGSDKVFTFQIRANIGEVDHDDQDLDTLTTMQERSRDTEYNVTTTP